MLGEFPIDVVIEVSDLEAARHFYVDQLQLEIVREDPRGAIDLRVGPSGLISLKLTPDRGFEEQTRASWRVQDLRAELNHLKTRGVEPVEYDFPGLSTVDGIADLGFAHGAWIADPANNVIGLMQYPA
jgi:catechol 2,3-dioxygenase-like lactoylglutathione lyase family enzyme